MIKTKIELAEEIRNEDFKKLIIYEINQLYWSMKAELMPHGSKERLDYLNKSNELIASQNEQKIVLKAIDRKIEQYKKAPNTNSFE